MTSWGQNPRVRRAGNRHQPRRQVRSRSGSTAPGRTETIALRVDGLTDTSVLVRVPAAKEARSETRKGPTPPVTKPASKRIAVACEPPVSVLTEVAKLLQPGRCVT